MGDTLPRVQFLFERSLFAPTELLQDSLAVFIPLSAGRVKGVFFRIFVESAAFEMYAGASDSAMGIVRCGTRVEVPQRHPTDPDLKLEGLALAWGPTFLYAAASFIGGKLVVSTVETAPIFVPPEIIALCEERQWLPEPRYETDLDVFTTVDEALLRAGSTFPMAHHAFWDKAVPKPETHVVGTIGAYLRHLERVKKIHFVREPDAGGSGRIDFLFTGHTRDDTTVHVCMEVKRSDHRDLRHGLRTQLPEYMKRVGARFGIFLVLDYGPGFRPGSTPELHELSDELNMIAAAELGPRHLDVRVRIFPVTPLPQPSKM